MAEPRIPIFPFPTPILDPGPGSSSSVEPSSLSQLPTVGPIPIPGTSSSVEVSSLSPLPTVGPIPTPGTSSSFEASPLSLFPSIGPIPIPGTSSSVEVSSLSPLPTIGPIPIQSSDGPASTPAVMSGMTIVLSTDVPASNPSNTSSTPISTSTVHGKGDQGRVIPIKLVAGSTAGAALGLILLVLYIVWWSWRRRKRSVASRPKMNEGEAPDLENVSTLDTSNIPINTAGQDSAGECPRVMSPSEVEQVDVVPMSPVIIKVHDDSGLRLPHGQVLDLPPAYTPD